VNARETYDTNVDALTWRASPTEREARLRVIFTALDAQDAQDAAGSPTCQIAGRGPVARPTEQPGIWRDDDLAHCVSQAEKGDSGSARRVAELLELNNRNDEAVAWWHRAADLGDEDAIDYIREFLSK
jgi:hypothetical protein